MVGCFPESASPRILGKSESTAGGLQRPNFHARFHPASFKNAIVQIQKSKIYLINMFSVSCLLSRATGVLSESTSLIIWDE